MSAYYNEHDAEKAAWIRELMKTGTVVEGEVDERDIRQVRADDLKGFRQCHFFAGVAVWSYALRLAGWPDDRAVWTGSCPCPSFSCAGKGAGFDDPRHLWPVWYPLIRECRPGVLFGEQANDAVGYGWLDLVSTDMEAAGYAFAAAVLGAHSVGAGHRRQRLYFCADSAGARYSEAGQHGSGSPLLSARSQQCSRIGHGADSDGREPSDGDKRGREQRLLAEDCATGDGAHAESGRLQQHDASERAVRLLGAGCEPDKRQHAAQKRSEVRPSLHREYDGMQPADGCEPVDGSDATERGFAMRGSAPGNRRHAALTNETSLDGDAERARLEGHFGDVRDWRGPGWLDPLTARSVAEAGATRGFWGDCDWWHARDGKYRPIEPGLFPLAHGATNRVLKLRGYGDAIVPQVAQAFIEAYLGVKTE